MYKTRQELLESLNRLIEEEHGKEVSENVLLTDCEVDSLGYYLLWLGMEEVCGTPFGKEYINSIDYSNYKVSDMLDKIEELTNENRKVSL